MPVVELDARSFLSVRDAILVMLELALARAKARRTDRPAVGETA